MNKTVFAILLCVGLGVIWVRSENRKAAWTEEKAAAAQQVKLAAGVEGVEKTEKDFALSCPTLAADGSRMIVLHSEEAGKIASEKLGKGYSIKPLMVFYNAKSEQEMCIRSTWLYENAEQYSILNGTDFGKGVNAACAEGPTEKTWMRINRTSLDILYESEISRTYHRAKSIGTCQIIDFKQGTRALSETILNAVRINKEAADKAFAEQELKLRNRKI